MPKELWDIEKALWLEGEEFFADHMVDDAVMVFPQPVGILRGAEILEGLKDAPRWTSVGASDLETIKRDGLAVLAYRASGERAGADRYEAYCLSTYEQREGEWLIVAHQQTPV